MSDGTSQKANQVRSHRPGCKPGGACSWGCDQWEYAPEWGPMEWTPGVDPLRFLPVKRTCPTCDAGLDTDTHHAECVAPLDQLDGGA